MSSDFDNDVQRSDPSVSAVCDATSTLQSSLSASRSARGAMSHARGVAAEAQVMQHYQRQGMELIETRWRGRSGEIDLILRSGAEVVFVEVKSSRTHAAAAAQLSRRQLGRLARAAEEFIGSLPDGALTPMRMDAALVDGKGQIEVIENITMDA